jgi:DNA-binding GntR family transcriptional regulator
MLSIQTRELAHESNDEHKAVVAALKNNDPTRAADLLRNHIIGGKKRYLGNIIQVTAKTVY